MTYVKGNTIVATDLNGFLATTRAVYGVGTGDKGYGQTTVTQADVASGDTISGTQWTNIRTMLVACANHQGTAQTLLPTSGLLVSGQTVTAHETGAPSSNTYDLDTVVTAIDTNRLTAAGGSMTLTSGAHSVTRGTTWSSSITTTVDVVFGSENAARYFFNSGGQVRIRFSHPNGVATQDNDWRTILGSKIGTLTIGATTASLSGSETASLTGSMGYYNMTTTAANVFAGTNIGGGAYSANDVSITAAVRNRAAVNGGNGDTIRFVITLDDQHTGSSDTVATGTQVLLDHYRATTYLTGIVVPTYSTVVAF